MPFKTAPELECFLPNISSTVCFPIRRVLLRLAPRSALPALHRERQLRSSAFPNQTDNLSLRCFSRKSKNNCILFPVRPVPSFLRHGGRWSRVCLQIPEPNCNLEWFAFCPHIMPSCAFQHCTSTWVLFAKCLKHSMLPYPPSVAKTGSALPALQRERQLRSSAFTNQTDNLSLRCFSRKSKKTLHSFSNQASAFIVTSWWEVIAGVLSNPGAGANHYDLYIVICLLPTYDAQLCLSRLHQNLSAFCQIFQSQYASPSAECC